ncbi:uncharacterized protein L203_105603 [Cryptococcus depauperatus CBS 7841]|uniref:Uncharacterized protein n=1 Tax=Cryptococcus depauperatus CBS 7841 TaxID=1295531 RepID=A0AAJ8JXP9_9TREE
MTSQARFWLTTTPRGGGDLRPPKQYTCKHTTLMASAQITPNKPSKPYLAQKDLEQLVYSRHPTHVAKELVTEILPGATTVIARREAR